MLSSFTVEFNSFCFFVKLFVLSVKWNRIACPYYVHKNQNALESDSSVEYPLKLPKKTTSAFNGVAFKFQTALWLQQKWFYSAKFQFFFSQLYKWIFFSISLYYKKKSVALSKVLSYSFILTIKHLQHCWYIFCFVCSFLGKKKVWNKIMS